MREKDFWEDWKRKTTQEIKYIKSLQRAILWLKSQPFIKEIEAVYVKGSFVFRELRKKSDIDLVVVVRNKKALDS